MDVRGILLENGKRIEKSGYQGRKKNRLHSKQKKALFVEQQEELVRKITTKRAQCFYFP